MFRWLGIILTVSLSQCVFLNFADCVAADNPVKLAAQGRFDLLSDYETGDLTSGESDTAGVKVERRSWVPAKNQSLGYVVSGPISHRGWREWKVSFVPKNSGRVTLTLKGPWEERSPGAIFRQEVLWVAFELLNEPKDAATAEVLNPIYAEAIKLIRQTNPWRTIFVGPGKWNSAFELSNLRLPDDDRNLIVTVHCYEPMPGLREALFPKTER